MNATRSFTLSQIAIFQFVLNRSKSLDDILPLNSFMLRNWPYNRIESSSMELLVSRDYTTPVKRMNVYAPHLLELCVV